MRSSGARVLTDAIFALLFSSMCCIAIFKYEIVTLVSYFKRVDQHRKTEVQ